MSCIPAFSCSRTCSIYGLLQFYLFISWLFSSSHSGSFGVLAVNYVKVVDSGMKSAGRWRKQLLYKKLFSHFLCIPECGKC